MWPLVSKSMFLRPKNITEKASVAPETASLEAVSFKEKHISFYIVNAASLLGNKEYLSVGVCSFVFFTERAEEIFFFSFYEIKLPYCDCTCDGVRHQNLLRGLFFRREGYKVVKIR